MSKMIYDVDGKPMVFCRRLYERLGYVGKFTDFMKRRIKKAGITEVVIIKEKKRGNNRKKEYYLMPEDAARVLAFDMKNSTEMALKVTKILNDISKEIDMKKDTTSVEKQEEKTSEDDGVFVLRPSEREKAQNEYFCILTKGFEAEEVIGRIKEIAEKECRLPEWQALYMLKKQLGMIE